MLSSKCQFQSSATFLTLLLLFVFIENISIMVLTWSQYKNVSKEELIQELTDKNSSFVNNINAKLTNLSEKFNKFRSKYEKVYSEFAAMKSCYGWKWHFLAKKQHTAKQKNIHNSARTYDILIK